MALKVGDRVKAYYTDGDPRAIGMLTGIRKIGGEKYYYITIEQNFTKLFRTGETLPHRQNSGKIVRLVKRKK